MNDCISKILNNLKSSPFTSQRILSESIGYSLGKVNQTIQALINDGYLTNDIQLTKKAADEMNKKKPANAVILAAGYGMRMVPINNEMPKAFIEINGEKLIERLIRQLHEAGIYEINIVVGFMKERFEYLIDKYQVHLIVNPRYTEFNNIYSLNLVRERLSNTFIIPCDIWCKNNPFNNRELYSWYMVGEWSDENSDVKVNRKQELITVSSNQSGNAMLGIAYLLQDTSDIVKNRLANCCSENSCAKSFWEATLYKGNKLILLAKEVRQGDAFEINTYEQLREQDASSKALNSDTIALISSVFECSDADIKNITVLKKGMTNRSFLFQYKEDRYIMRIPGEGTEKLINRKQEAAVYNKIKNTELCDDIYYINPDNGYKITKYFENCTVCDSENLTDVKKCMRFLKQFHEQKLTVEHSFDLFHQIEFYESLWNGTSSMYPDYTTTKEHVFELKKYIDAQDKAFILTHIDAVPDNFLFLDSDNKEDIRLIDWEYSAMQDPHVDIAMFAIYSLYDRKQTEQLIALYFEGNCPKQTRLKIYCYIAVCGLLWSNWCEYKYHLGIEFGEYSLRQYRYAKDYYKIFKEEVDYV